MKAASYMTQKHHLQINCISKYSSVKEKFSQSKVVCSVRHYEVQYRVAGKVGVQALQAVGQMHQQGKPLARERILPLLQECIQKKDLTAARLLFSSIVTSGLDSVAVFRDHLIRLFASCGSLHEANKIFCKVANPSVYTWHAIISAHASLGENEMALQLYHRMQCIGLKPDKVIILCAVRTCGNVGIGHGRVIHDQIVRSGLNLDLALGTSLVDMYVKRASLDEACKVFDEVASRDVILWSALIAGYVQHGHGSTVLELFETMLQEGIKPDRVTFSCTLKACRNVRAVVQGRLIHDQIIRNGLQSDAVVGSSLVDMYAKCGDLEEALKVFCCLPFRDVVSWSTMIAGYANCDEGMLALELFEKMQQEGIRADGVTLLCVLKACCSLGALCQGRHVHDQIIRSGCHSDVVIGNSLIDMYAKCGDLEQARRVFDDLQNQTLVSWDIMIAGYAQHGYGFPAHELFEKMQQEGVIPDNNTFSCILKSCDMGFIKKGRHIHAQIISHGLEADTVLGNALIDMYAKCGCLEQAHKVFDELPSRDVASWGAMISGYTKAGNGLFALELFEKMQHDGIDPDQFTYSCILKACGSREAIEQGRLIHKQIIISAHVLDMVLESTIVEMYVECGSLEEARKVLDEFSDCDIVSWNAIIAGYAQHQQALSALDLYKRMQHNGRKPNNVTFLCVLKACSGTGAIKQGQLIHNQIISCGLESDVVIGNTLIDMYSKCGSLDGAQNVFHGLSTRNAVSWNAMISGYSHHGDIRLALESFEDMQSQGFKPDGRTYTSILGACSHASEVDKVYQYFKSMREDHNIIPTIEHFDCMVDLLGRAGCLEEAEQLLKTMPILPDDSGWMSLLSACKTYSNLELGRRCFDQIVGVDPKSAAGYVLMSNIYADAHKWKDVSKLQELKSCESAWRKPGMAWIEVNNRIQEFIVGSRSFSSGGKMDSKLNRLTRLMKEQGYSPRLNLVLQSVLDEDMENPFLRQCDELAINFGFLTTLENTATQFSETFRDCIVYHIARDNLWEA